MDQREFISGLSGLVKIFDQKLNRGSCWKTLQAFSDARLRGERDDKTGKLENPNGNYIKKKIQI